VELYWSQELDAMRLRVGPNETGFGEETQAARW
jgi:hypothetical protein